jgi:uncharacterized membrane protein
MDFFANTINSAHSGADLKEIRPKRRRACATLLLAILAVGAVLRFCRIDATSLWLDEIWSIEMAIGRGSVHDTFPDGVIRYDQPELTALRNAAPLWHVWNDLRIVAHPPLYFVLLRAWMDVLGSGPAGARSLSALFSLGGILVFFDVCRQLNGRRIAFWAAALMTLSIAQIDFGQEARSYPMLIFWGLCTCDCVVRIERFGASSGRLSALAVFLAATALTHYFSAGALFALAFYSVLRLRGTARRRTLYAFAGALIFCLLAWGPQFVVQARSVPRYLPSYLRESSGNHVALTLFRIAELPLQFLLGEKLERQLPGWAPVCTFTVVVALTIFLLRTRRETLLWAIWAAGIVGSIALLDLVKGATFLQYLRYTILASPAIFAIFAGFELRGPWVLRNGLPVALVLILLVLDAIRLGGGVESKEDFRQLAKSLNAYAAPDELLIFHNDSLYVSPGVWYMGFKYYAPDSRRPWVTLHHAADAALLKELANRDSLWLIGQAPQRDASTVLPGWHAVKFQQTTAGGICLMERDGNGGG